MRNLKVPVDPSAQESSKSVDEGRHHGSFKLRIPALIMYLICGTGTLHNNASKNLGPLELCHLSVESRTHFLIISSMLLTTSLPGRQHFRC